MKSLLLASAFALGLAAPAFAQAASSPPYSVNVPPPPATNVVCNPLAGWTLSGSVFSDGTAPIAPGTPICTVVVTPTGWSGNLTLAGADAALFVLTTAVPPTVNVGTGGLPARATPYVFGPVNAN